MTETLPSFLAGTWQAGSGEGSTVADAVTGETLHRVSAAGLDLPSAVSHARDVGGPTLRAMTFPERAELVKAVGLAEELGR
jgi:oxepin-CoA hydrolase/3-oxo-5,6-dehydrosuberyl-CoA semialdehyde dehydrogenase